MYWANLMWLVRTHVLYCIYVCMQIPLKPCLVPVGRLNLLFPGFRAHSYILLTLIYRHMYQCTFVYLFYVRIHMCIFLLCCFLNKCFTLNAETCFGQQRHMNSFILVNIAMWTVYKCVQMRLNATIDGAIVVRACYMSLSWKTNS